MSDVALLAERCGALQEEIKTWEAKVDEVEAERDYFRRRMWWERWWVSLTIFVVVCCVLAVAGYPAYMALTTSSTPTHCRVIGITSYGLFRLGGVVPWGSDLTYGYFTSVPDAMSAAEELGCEVRSQR